VIGDEPKQRPEADQEPTEKASIVRRRADPTFPLLTSLYDKICRPDILEHAYCAGPRGGNAGATRVGRSDLLRRSRASGLGRVAGGTCKRKLVTKTYRPAAGAGRGDDPEAGGWEERPLGIPTIRDRGGPQNLAAKLRAGADLRGGTLRNSAYGYRPPAGAEWMQSRKWHRLIYRGYNRCWWTLIYRNTSTTISRIRGLFAFKWPDASSNRRCCG